MRQLRLSRKERLLFLTPLLVLTIPILYYVVGGGDRLDTAQRELAGANAIDCGVGHIKTAENNVMYVNRAQVDACSVAAFKAGKPFRVRYDTETDEAYIGNDSFGIVRTPKGQIYFFSYYWYSQLWWKKRYFYHQAICPAPKLIPHPSSNNTVLQTVGCGTCANNDSENTDSCILR